MKTEQQAWKAACRKAAHKNRDYNVVLSVADDEGDGPYFVATDEEVDTFFSGCKVVLHCHLLEGEAESILRRERREQRS